MASIVFLIQNYLNSSSSPFFSLVFLLPIVYLILFNYIKQTIIKKVNSETKDPYTFELKIRKILYKQDEIDVDTKEKVEEMFERATELFLEFQPLFL